MANGNTKSASWLLVIDPPKKEPYTSDLDLCRKCLNSYTDLIVKHSCLGFNASIIHDKDKLPNGEPKLIHAHAYLETEHQTKSNLLNFLAELLNIDKGQISAEPTNNNYLGVQYLIHKNDTSKTPYEQNLIKTNNPLELQTRLNTKYTAPSNQQEIILSALENEPTFSDFIHRVGPEVGRKYLPCFKQIKADQEKQYKQSNLAYKLIKIESNLYELQGLINELQSTIEANLGHHITEGRLADLFTKINDLFIDSLTE